MPRGCVGIGRRPFPSACSGTDRSDLSSWRLGRGECWMEHFMRTPLPQCILIRLLKEFPKSSALKLRTNDHERRYDRHDRRVGARANRPLTRNGAARACWRLKRLVEFHPCERRALVQTASAPQLRGYVQRVSIPRESAPTNPVVHPTRDRNLYVSAAMRPIA